MRLAIWKGMDHREYYTLPASKLPVSIRPLSQIEVDQCYADALDRFPREAQETVVKAHAGIMKPTDPFPSSTEISDVQLYYNEVLYHMFAVSACIVQEDGSETPIDVEDVRNLPYGDNVKGLVQRIMRISGVNTVQSEEDINYFMTNSDGEVLAHIHTKLGVPITDKAWKLTPLQYRYLNELGEEKVKEARSYDDILQFFGMVKQNGGQDAGRSRVGTGSHRGGERSGSGDSESGESQRGSEDPGTGAEGKTPHSEDG